MEDIPQRVSKNEGNIEHLNKLQSALFKKLDDMPDTVGRIVENKILDYERREEIRRKYEAEWKLSIEKKVENNIKTLADHAKWRDGMKTAGATAFAIVTGLATFFSWILDRIFS